jgi:hypothetical protein
MKKFLAAVFFTFVVPYLLYTLAMSLMPHPDTAAAIGYTFFFDIISVLIGIWCAKGCQLPDN